MTVETQNPVIQLLAKELTQYRLPQITKVLELLHDGNTVPFIARYRKEMTNALDEVQIREIEERYHYLENLEKRKEEVLRIIDEQGKLTEDLAKRLQKAHKLQEIEDLYRPYKQKRRTKATIAKEQGLEPLADWLMTFPKGEIQSELEKYLTEDLLTTEDVLAGVHEILA
ncbi:MAG TPA: Tex-like N-terminal domain-containing protein, partial [Enterococcus aquimarinus]|nr:Tex-like N-terminal domain-containing protein [Enterococcus aquimarinus]